MAKMDKVVSGVQRFQNEVFHEHRDLFTQLATQQQPRVLFITCSDSRIAPHLITQTGPGDLFVIRNAGNLVPPYGETATGEAGTIEYAVGVLGVEHVVVCGHSNCGAMLGLLNPSLLEQAPTVARWLRHAAATRRIVDERYPHLDGDDLLMAAVEQNVLVQIDNLRTHPAVAAALSCNKLGLHAWTYNIGTGCVSAFDYRTARFAPLGDASALPNQLLAHKNSNQACKGHRAADRANAGRK